MKSKTIAFLTLAVFTIIGWTSCEQEELLSTFNVYYVDNQSSHTLIYNISNRKINIETGTSKEIFLIERIDKLRIDPDEVLKDNINSQGTVYLFRDSNGTEIEALNIYMNTDLTWEEEEYEAVDGSHIFNHILTVTDDMIE